MSLPRTEKAGRAHPLLPTRGETTADNNAGYSDHVAIMAEVPVGNNDKFKVVSWNVLEKTDRSGVHVPTLETKEQLHARNLRIVAALVKIIEKNQPQAICLQEAGPDLLALLQNEIKSKNLKMNIVHDAGNNDLITLFSDQVKPQPGKYNRDGIMQPYVVNYNGMNIALRNVHTSFQESPELHEDMYRTALNSDSNVTCSILIGDTNSHVIPVKPGSRNIATGIVPPGIAQSSLGVPLTVQATDFSDGGFVRAKDGTITQLDTVTLDHTTGNIYNEDMSQESAIEPKLDHWRIGMLLDNKQLTDKNFHQGQSVADYEKQLQTTYNDDQVSVRFIAKDNNERGIAIQCSKDSFLSIILAKESGTQPVTIQPPSDDLFKQKSPRSCFFIPSAKQNKVLTVLASYNELYSELFDVLDKAIAKCKKDEIRGKLLTELRDALLDKKNSLNLSQTVKAWMNKDLVHPDTSEKVSYASFLSNPPKKMLDLFKHKDNYMNTIMAISKKHHAIVSAPDQAPSPQRSQVDNEAIQEAAKRNIGTATNSTSKVHEKMTTPQKDGAVTITYNGDKSALDTIDIGQSSPSTKSNNEYNDYDILLKFNVIGHAGSGVSKLVLRYTDDTYTDSYASSIGVDHKLKTVEIGNSVVRLQLVDKPSGTHQRSDTAAVHGCHISVVVFDVTDRDSFNNLSNLINNARNSNPLSKIILVGNKCDDASKRVVNTEEVNNFVGKFNGNNKQIAAYVEASAKTGVNVDAAFEAAAKVALRDFNVNSEKKNVKEAEREKPRFWSR